MFDTYKIINAVSTKDLNSVDLNDLAIQFQNSKDEHFRNKCFAHVFKQVYPMLLKLHHDSKYSRLTNDEKTESCVFCTLHAMNRWKPKRGQKLTSYIYMIVNNDFKTLVSKSYNNKNKVFQSLCHNLSDTTKSYILNSVTYNSSEKVFNYIKDLKSSPILTKDEISYCQNILKGYKTTKEMAKVMFSDIKQITTTRGKNHKLVTKPVNDESDLAKYVGQLKTSIKRKLKENHNSPF
jgi:hypothetical protein